MRDVAESCRVALVQAEPVMFDRQAGVAKTLELIGQAAKSRPNLIVFPVTQTPWGPVGGLICWESYMPLARVALYQKGVTIYISPNTNDNPEWQATIQHIAIEGKCFFVNADMLVRRSSYPAGLAEQEAIDALPDVVCRGGSCIIDPFGHYVTEPVWDEEKIIVADLDMSLPAASKMEHDPVGHYARPDVLELVVHEG